MYKHSGYRNRPIFGQWATSTLAAVLAGASLALGACDSDRSERAKLEAKLAEIEAIVETGDNEAWVGLFAEDAVAMPPNSPPAQGLDAIRALYEPAFDGYADISVDYTLMDVEIEGPLAVMRYAGQATLTRESGQSYQSSTHYVDALRQQPDGEWKITLHAWSREASDAGTPDTVSESLSAREIVSQATQAAGGDAWRLAESIHLQGYADLYRGGMQLKADRYEMFRIYPRRLEDADTASGKFRLDAYVQDQVLFQSSFDGETMYNQQGPLPADEGAERAAAAFGFSAIRFALADGSSLNRMADDQVDGHPCYFVRVIDPSGGQTLFGIDQQDSSIRLVAWDTPQGWHHRIYSDFYWVEDPGFRQPGRVRLYYDGVKNVDIRWTEASVNVAIPDKIFSLGSPGS
jgi:uncharacterized protein (TIGR02246 family)